LYCGYTFADAIKVVAGGNASMWVNNLKSMQPKISYYAKFELCTDGNKTPKYQMTQVAGYCPAMEQLKGKNGRVSLYLMPRRGDKSAEPPMHLQAKNSLRFTGLKDYYINGRVSGFAYGEPNSEKEYSKQHTPNPLFAVKNDGFLFRFSDSMESKDGADVPASFELLIIDGGRVLASGYCKMLQMGGFDADLELLRQQAARLD